MKQKEIIMMEQRQNGINVKRSELETSWKDDKKKRKGKGDQIGQMTNAKCRRTRKRDGEIKLWTKTWNYSESFKTAMH